jgi:hypothetical protein
MSDADAEDEDDVPIVMLGELRQVEAEVERLEAEIEGLRAERDAASAERDAVVWLCIHVADHSANTNFAGRYWAFTGDYRDIPLARLVNCETLTEAKDWVLRAADAAGDPAAVRLAAGLAPDPKAEGVDYSG